MQVAQIGQLLAGQPGEIEKKQEAGDSSFAGLLNDSLKKLNEAELKADSLAGDLLTGDIQDLHQVTIAVEEAKLSIQLAIEVRNKVIEAYQEISRMQV